MPHRIDSEGMIRESINETTHLAWLTEIERRKVQSEVLWPVASAGEFIGDFEPRRTDLISVSNAKFRTERALSGEARTLRRKTLIGIQAFRLPLNMSGAAFERFFDGSDPRADRGLALVTVHEPGATIFRPIKTDTYDYLETNEKGASLAAFAVHTYLNSESAFTSSQSELDKIGKEIAVVERAYDTFIETQLKDLLEIAQGNDESSSR